MPEIVQPAVEAPAKTDPATPAPEPSGDAHKFAGKFDTPDALEDGVRNIRTKLGFETPEGALFGPGGIYSDVGAMEREYLGLQRQMGRLGTPSPEPAATPQSADTGDGLDIQPPPQPEPASGTIEAELQRIGLDAQDLAQQYNAQGQLTASQYKTLKDAGYSRVMVDATMQGMKAQAQLQATQIQAARAEVQQMLGGEQVENTIREWAQQQAEADPRFKTRLASLNEMVKANPATHTDMMTILKGEYERTSGTPAATQMATGGTTPPTSSALPRNYQEFEALQAKATMGDKAAAATIASLTPQQIHSLLM